MHGFLFYCEWEHVNQETWHIIYEHLHNKYLITNDTRLNAFTSLASQVANFRCGTRCVHACVAKGKNSLHVSRNVFTQRYVISRGLNEFTANYRRFLSAPFFAGAIVSVAPQREICRCISVHHTIFSMCDALSYKKIIITSIINSKVMLYRRKKISSRKQN